MKKTKVTLIILSFNTKDLLRMCLDSIKKISSKGLDIQTIVVDNASSDDSVKMIKKDFSWVELIESKVNVGYAAGNNIGIKKAKGEYIIFLNSDVELKKDAIVKVVDCAKSDKGIGAITPRVDLYIGGMDPDCHRGFPTPWASICYFLGIERLFPRSKLFGQYHMGYADLNSLHEIDAGFGTFMLVTRQVIKSVGVWDDKYFFYGEDLDYFYRIKQKGFKVVFFPELLAIHHKGASSGLRKESKKTSPASKATRINTAKASINAWDIFYKKFYKGKYPNIVTYIIILGIKAKGTLRLIKVYLSK